ncbi:glycosyltransferase [Legionella sp. PATHC038]|uniref:glycosyltransferase n=1 Tax=Legionella sheltonii TaxID=2992041 RepID=UPI002244B3F0|nr:glycosyltransferase [Legionella sp. PATHC038]MCW8399148.1 glycosyltransferase [Legionella sp. PATHC038]
MRVITVLDSYPPDLNGGAYFTHRLALQLQQRGHEVLVICPSRSVRQEYTTYQGVHLYRVRSWPVWIYRQFRVCWPLFIRKGIEQAIRTFQPDVIHLQGRFFLGGICFRLGKKLQIPMVATNHFMPENFFHYTHLPSYLKPWFARRCWRPILDMLRQVDAVTTPTKTAAALLEALDNRFPVHAISCGVNLNVFRPHQEARPLRLRLGLPNKPTLLYCGRLDQEKNLPMVITAFAQARNHVDAHFVLTGTGAYESHLKQHVAQLGMTQHVTFAGYLSDAEYPFIYGLADCFVIASTAELQSIVTLEAIASGLPILAANAMALPELVQPGINGYLFAENDVEGLSQLLMNMLSNQAQCQAMGRASRQLALQHDIEHSLEQYEALYRKVSRS